MIRRTITLFIFFVTVICFFPAEAPAFSFSFSAHPTGALKQTDDYTAKFQPGLALTTGFSAPISEKYFLQLGARYFGFMQSGGGSDWVVYRGFSGMSASIGGGFLFPELLLFKRFPAGPSLAFRGYGNFASYNYTDIYFIFLTFEMEPMMQFLSFNKNQMALQLGAPITWNYQRDVDIFLTAGISVRILFSLNGKAPRV